MEAVAVLKQENGLWYVYSEKGKKLSKGYKTKKEAKRRLIQIEYWKERKK